jgi:Sensors of blue-light using FAD
MMHQSAIVQITYVSKASMEFGTADLLKLLIDSRNYNKDNDITGILIFENDKFLQVIEGSGDTTENLFQRIVKDGRHHDVNLIASKEVARHEFPKWTMAFAGAGSLARYSFRGFKPIIDSSDQSNTTDVLDAANRLLNQFSGFFRA